MIGLLLLAAAAQVDVQGANGERVHVGPNGVVVDGAHGRTVVRGSGSVTATGRGGAAVSGAGGRITASCAAGQLAVSGSNQQLHVAGVCTTVQLTGSHNIVFATLAPGAAVSVAGSHNQLVWHAAVARGRPPQVSSAGTGNTVTQR